MWHSKPLEIKIGLVLSTTSEPLVAELGLALIIP
jgi:hypothetical protein